MKRRVLLHNALVILTCLALILLLDRRRQGEHRRQAIKAVSDHTAQLLAEQLNHSIGALESIGAFATREHARMDPVDTVNLLASFIPAAEQQGIKGLILITEAGPVASACAGGAPASGHACDQGRFARRLPAYEQLSSSQKVVALPWSNEPDLLQLAALRAEAAGWVMPIGVRTSNGPWLFGLLARATYDAGD